MSIGWIIFVLAVIGLHAGLFGMFKKAGIDGWKALIPIYNTWFMVKKMDLKTYWFFFSADSHCRSIRDNLDRHQIRGAFWKVSPLASRCDCIDSFHLFSLPGIFKK